MDYLAQYYKNKCKKLQENIDAYEKFLSDYNSDKKYWDISIDSLRKAYEMQRLNNLLNILRHSPENEYSYKDEEDEYGFKKFDSSFDNLRKIYKKYYNYNNEYYR